MHVDPLLEPNIKLYMFSLWKNMADSDPEYLRLMADIRSVDAVSVTGAGDPVQHLITVRNHFRIDD